MNKKIKITVWFFYDIDMTYFDSCEKQKCLSENAHRHSIRFE